MKAHTGMEPEYLVVESEKTHLTGKLLGNSDRNYQAVQADLALLYQELNISVDILGKIRDSVHVLELSLRELQ